MKKIPVWKVAPLLLVTGLCGLVYQMVWLRQLRLVFGSSTAATGMVLAVFMGGLGIGAVILGKLADRSNNPLSLYGRLELGIAVSAMLSPLLIFLVNKSYIFLGGTIAMGLPLATVVRILLSFLVLGVPTFLMGGTLPAAIRAVETDDDRGRRDLSLLYGINTIGGVLGVGLATFVMLELLGNRATIWSASLLNILAGLTALWIARHETEGCVEQSDAVVEKQASTEIAATAANAPVPWIYAAALVSGFSFLLMELVWYRMLAPLLGGSIYTFSLVLAVALTGIGIGSAVYSRQSRFIRPTVMAFGVICGLEALFMAIPYGLGDSLAVLTALVKPFGIVGFSGQLCGWLVVTSIVVLLPAVMAGIQFPMLIGLLGQGSRDVGRHTGYVYGWNTCGAILGSLAGGFGFIPWLSAPGCWQLVVLLLGLLSVLSLLVAAKNEGQRLKLMVPVSVVFISALLLTLTGPTATWRHQDTGHSADLAKMNRNELREWRNEYPRVVIWEQDGRESSVALRAYDGLSFIVNGKSDGHVISDAGTQVMGPLVGAILHPEPKQAMVIGLGTGSSAGWLAEVSSIERVDVVELEPAIIEVARKSAPVNFNVVSHPKVKITIGDAREIVQIIDRRYDVIFSEPSNPYRAGIASLYTKEFYESVAGRLNPKGIFSQWVQAYAVDQKTISTISATLASVFADVEIWLTHSGDMLFVCSREGKKYPVKALRKRLAAEPFRSALINAWGVSGLEGFLAGFIGRGEVARKIFAQESEKGRINSDDRMLVEFGFARSAGRKILFSLSKMRQVIREKNLHRPTIQGGGVDWGLVDESFVRMMLWQESAFVAQEKEFSSEQKQRAKIVQAYNNENFQRVYAAFRSGFWKTETPMEKAIAAEALAEKGDDRSVQMAREIASLWPATADAIMARYQWRRGDREAAFESLTSAFRGFRTQPWQMKQVVSHSLTLAIGMAYNKYRTQELFELLTEPFSVYNSDEYRKLALALAGRNIDYHHAARALALMEPYIPWKESVLRYRAECYEAINSPLAKQAERDLDIFLKYKAPSFSF